MNQLEKLAEAKQSAWLDYIRKDLIADGELLRWMDQGVTGVTSNPTLFEQAIAKTDLYREDIARLAAEGLSTMQIYERLAQEDISRAADILMPVFLRTAGRDGFVSLEVPPDLCDDARATVEEAHRLREMLGRPNVMIKVPATEAGLKAVSQLIADGVPVNVTLMFSLADYEAVADAYISGLEERARRNQPLGGAASVASVFVSRLDAAVEAAADPDIAEQLRGKVAIANTRRIYAKFREVFESARFQRLSALGAPLQRPLWASTGAKNPRLPDTLYVDALVAADTVNTMPPATLTAFADHGSAEPAGESFTETDREVLRLCEQHGIDVDGLAADLKQKGLRAFSESFASLLQAIEKVRSESTTEA